MHSALQTQGKTSLYRRASANLSKTLKTFIKPTQTYAKATEIYTKTYTYRTGTTPPTGTTPQTERSRDAGGTQQERRRDPPKPTPGGPIYTSETYTNLRKACANLCETYVKPLQNLCKPIEHLHKHIRNLEIQQTQDAKLYQLCKHIKSQKHYVRKWNAAGTQGSFMLYDEIKFKEKLTQKLKMLGKVN